MSTTHWGSSKGAGSQTASTTGYGRITNGGYPRYANENTEAYVQNRMYYAGVFSDMSLYVQTHDRGTAATLTFRKNGADGNQTLSFSNSGYFQDTTHTDTVASGDSVGFKLVVGSGGTTTIDRIWGINFTPSDPTKHVCMFTNGGNITYSTASTSYYHPPISVPGTSTTEGDQQLYMYAAGTMKNMSVYVESNARTTATDIRLRKNGANGNLLVSFGNAESGHKEDVTNSDTVSVGDLLNWQLTTGTGTGNFKFQYVSAFYETAAPYFYTGFGTSSGTTFNVNTTTYLCNAGQDSQSTTESQVASQIRLPAKFSNYQASIRNNTVSATSTLTLRKNSSSAGMTISIGSNQSGRLTESSPTTVTVQVGDKLDSQLVTGATGTSMRVHYVVLQGRTGASGLRLWTTHLGGLQNVLGRRRF